MSARLKGLTLIEVLIALLVLSVALAAIIQAVSVTLRSQAQLDRKLSAVFLADNTMTSVRLGLIRLPMGTSSTQKALDENGYSFDLQMSASKTSAPTIAKVQIDVRDASREDTDVPIYSLVGYRREVQKDAN